MVGIGLRLISLGQGCRTKSLRVSGMRQKVSCVHGRRVGLKPVSEPNVQCRRTLSVLVVSQKLLNEK